MNDPVVGPPVVDDFRTPKIIANQAINIIDPPKDMAVAGNSVSGVHRNNIKRYIGDLFSTYAGSNAAKEQINAAGIPGEFDPLGDKKEDIAVMVRQERFTGAYFTRASSKYRILRLKATSGHDPRPSAPSGLFVSYDNGPNDVTSDSRHIITGGTLLDPSTRKTDPAEVTYIINEYPRLPNANISYLGLNTCIAGDIVITPVAAGGWSVRIPLDPDRIGRPTAAGEDPAILTETFGNQCQTRAGSYFAGNATKNRYINENSADANYAIKCKKFILAKELGDTLQVEWLNYIFQAAATAAAAAGTNPTYHRGNTVITTTDVVVKYRCILNGVPVIHTIHQGDTEYWTPQIITAAEQAMMVRAEIDKIQLDLISANKNVITMFTNVISMPYIGAREEQWFGESSFWTVESVRRAKAFLTTVRDRLITINEDMNRTMSVMSTVDEARVYAAKSFFKNPFIATYNRDLSVRRYKPITSVNFLITDGRERFRAYLIVPTSFGADLAEGALHPRIQKGGQRGGSLDELIRRAIYNIELTVEQRGRLIGATSWSMYSRISAEMTGSAALVPVSMLGSAVSRVASSADQLLIGVPSYILGGIAYLFSGPASAETAQSRRLNTASETKATRETPNDVRDTEVDSYRYKEWIDIVRSSDMGAPAALSNDNPFIFLYVRRYYPEIFTYANFMQIGYLITGNTEDYTDYETLKTTYYTSETSYNFRSDDYSIPSNLTLNGNYSSAVNTMLRTKTLRAIKYAMLLILGSTRGTRFEGFSHLATKNLRYFLHLFRTVPYAHAMRGLPSSPAVEGNAHASLHGISTAPQGGGGLSDDDLEEKLPLASRIAIDLYELYYSLHLSANYLGVDPNEMLVERLRTLLNYEENIRLLEKNPVEDPLVKPIMEYEMHILYRELMNLSVMEKVLEEYDAMIEATRGNEFTANANATANASGFNNVNDASIAAEKNAFKQGSLEISVGGRSNTRKGRQTRKHRKTKKARKARKAKSQKD